MFTIQLGNFTVKFNSSLIRKFDEMVDIAQNEGQIMDTRSAEVYRGTDDGKNASYV